MGHKADARLTERVKDIIDSHDPAVTLDDLINTIDEEPDRVINAVEDLQRRGEVRDDIIFWRGASHSSVSS